MSAVELEPIQPTPLPRALRRLRTFVSPFTGVVHSVDEMLASPGEHRLITLWCELADGRPTVGGQVEEFRNLAVDRYWVLEPGKPARASR